MKNIIIGLLVLLAAIIGVSVALVLFASESDLYDTVEHANYDQILDEKTGSHVYYYYQPTCSHCNDLKPAMKTFVNKLETSDEVDIKFVDMAESENESGWYDWQSHYAKYGENTSPELNPDYKSDPEDMKTIDDIKITGTPTMIYVQDGKVQNYEVGNTPIEELMAQIEKEFNIS